MLRVSKGEGWLPRAHDAGPGRQDPHSADGCVIVRSSGCLPGGYPPVPAGRRPAAAAPGQAAGTEDCRRSGWDQPGGSGPSPGPRALRLHLVMIPPGTRGLAHLHPGQATACYVVSGESEVWHGAGLLRRSLVRAGDVIYVPPGTPHLAVNRGDVTSIAVVAHSIQEGSSQEDGGQEAHGQEDQAGSVTVELPRHLAGLLSYPVGYGG